MPNITLYLDDGLYNLLKNQSEEVQKDCKKRARKAIVKKLGEVA